MIRIINIAGFKIKQNKTSLLIKKKPSYFFSFLLAIIVPFILILAIYITTELLILLIPVLAIPFINDDWKFPSKMVFDSENQLVALNRPFFLKIMTNFNQIKNVSVSQTIQSAGTSSFEEGNKDYIHRIYLLLNDDSSLRLMKIKSRQEIPDKISQITDFIQHLIKPKAESLT